MTFTLKKENCEDSQVREFSFSSISRFEKCPWSYKLRYIDKQEEAFTSVEAWMGSTVHYVLEQAYRIRKEDNILADTYELEKLYDKFWYSAGLKRVKVVRDNMSTDYYYNKGRELLNSYIARVFRSDTSKTIALEYDFKMFVADNILYKGVIDRISRQEGRSIRVIDYKTGTVNGPLDTFQLKSYAVQVFKETGAEKLELVYEDLKKERCLCADVLREEAVSTVDLIREKAQKIINTESFPAKTSALCRWCGFNHICSLYKVERERECEAEKLNICPQCSRELVKREGKFGLFWGCSGFPQCRYTRRIT